MLEAMYVGAQQQAASVSPFDISFSMAIGKITCGGSRHDNDKKPQDTQWASLAVQPHS